MASFINLPAYQVPNALSFQGINDAIGFNKQNALAQRQLGIQEQQLGMQKERHDIDMAQARTQQGIQEARQAVAFGDHIMTLPAEQRQAAWETQLSQPGWHKLAGRPEMRDVNSAIPMLRARAAEYLGEKDRSQIEMNRAHAGLFRAQEEKARREAADGVGGFGREIKPYQTSDGRVWGVQAGANGDRLMHDLSNPTSQPIYVPRGRNLPPGMAVESAPGTGGMSAPGTAMNGGWSTQVQGNYPGGQGAQVAQAPQPRYPNPPGLGGQGRSASAPSLPGPTQTYASNPSSPGPLTPFRGTKQVGDEIIDVGTGRTIRNVGDPLRGEAFIKKDAEAAVTDIKARNEAIQVARSKMPRLEMMARLIDRPDVYQGTGGNSVLEFKKAAQALGFEVEGVPAGEAVRMVANQFALALRNPAGGEGMPGALSDRDLAFLTQSVPGLGNTRGGNQIIVRTMIDLERYKIAENAEAARYLQKSRSTAGLPEHMQRWADRTPAISKATRDMIERATGSQYGVRSGPASGPQVEGKQQGRLREEPRSFADPRIGGRVPTIASDDDYHALPSGSQYYAPDGSLRRKN